jgi:hypothetical protein
MRNLITLFFALFFAGNIFSQNDNSQQIPPMRDGLREGYTESDFQNFLYKEKMGEIQNEITVIYSTAATDALVNNNNGSTGTSNFTQSETSIVAFGNNVVIGFNDSGSFTGGANKFTGWSYSTDGGASFTDGGTLPTSAVGDAGDPVLARNETTGRIYLSTLGFSGSGTIQMFRSDDNGVSWQAPVNATPGGSSEDKQWHIVDNFAGTGNGNVYLISRRFGGSQGIYMFRSTDNGNTFGPSGGVSIFSGGQGAFVAVGPDHSVYAFYYNGSTSILVRKSTDLGVTYGAPVTIFSGLTGGSNGDLGLTGIRQGTSTPSSFRSNSFPHVAVNPVSGHLYATFNNNPAGTDKADIYMTMSTDGGATWSAPVQINDDGTITDQWQPTIAVTPNGNRIGIFYYSRQEDTAGNNLFKYYGRTGVISGSVVTFAPGFAISDVASLPEFGRDNVVNSVYMGDYNHASATNSDFHVVWSDNRDDLPGGAPRKDPNVYYEKIVLGPPCPIDPPSNPNPPSGATGLPLTGNTASWTNGAGANQIEVWFGQLGSLVQVYNGAPITSLSLAPLEPLIYNTTYGWQVRGKNDTCTVSGPVWTFTTMQDPNLFQWCDDFANLNNWTIIGPLGLTNWSAASGSNAGGTPPELQMSWTPSFNGVSKIRSVVVALPNNQQVDFSFNFFLDWFANPSGVVTLATTYDGGATSTPFYTLTDPTGNVGPLLVTGNFTTPASGSQNTQIEITYNGNSFNTDNVYWDNLCLQYTVPVELTSFAASSNGAEVELSWTTATETNNQGFQVERLNEGGTFEQIGYVAGFGTTTEPKAYSFIDSKLEAGSYIYRLKQIDFNGSYEYSNEVNVDVTLPLEYTLEQNYPNPFNPSTTIKYAITEDGFVKLAIYNMLGEEVATIVNNIQKAGRYEVNFNASGLSSGVYVYRIEAANFTASKKLMLMK